MDLKEKLTELINDSLKKCNVECNKFVVERPNNKENGDYSTNVAMELTKVLHKNPREIANELVTNISDDNIIDIVHTNNDNLDNIDYSDLEKLSEVLFKFISENFYDMNEIKTGN